MGHETVKYLKEIQKSHGIIIIEDDAMAAFRCAKADRYLFPLHLPCACLARGVMVPLLRFVLCMHPPCPV